MINAARRRQAMTFIEVTIAGLIGLTVMGIAFTFYQHSTGMGMRAQQLSTASQAAAHFFYALEQDIANLIPNDKEAECFKIEDGDLVPGGEAGTRSFTFRRIDPDKSEQIGWADPRYDQRKSEGVSVQYKAKKGTSTVNPDLWVLSRVQGETPAHPQPMERFFTRAGTYAKDVRFSKVTMPRLIGPPSGDPTYYLRVTLVFVGDAVNKELKEPPLVPLSALYRMTVDPSAATDPFQL